MWGDTATQKALPDLTWQELLTIRDLAFNTVTTAELEDRFNSYGGCGKWVFPVMNFNVEQDIHKHLTGLTWIDLYNAITLTQSTAVSHLHFLLWDPADSFSSNAHLPAK